MGFTFSADESAKSVHTGLTAPEAVVLASLNAAPATAGWTTDRARKLREAVLTEGFRSAPTEGRGSRSRRTGALVWTNGAKRT